MVLITADKAALPRPTPEECVPACRLLECLVHSQTVSLIDHFLRHALLSSLHLLAPLHAANWQLQPRLVYPLFIMFPCRDGLKWSSAGVVSVETESVIVWSDKNFIISHLHVLFLQCLN